MNIYNSDESYYPDEINGKKKAFHLFYTKLIHKTREGQDKIEIVHFDNLPNEAQPLF